MSNNYNKMHGKPMKRKNRTYDTLDQKVRAWAKNVEHCHELLLDMAVEYESIGMILRESDKVDHNEQFNRLDFLTTHYQYMIDREELEINDWLFKKMQRAKEIRGLA